MTTKFQVLRTNAPIGKKSLEVKMLPPIDPVVTKEQEEAEVEWKDTFYKRSG